MSELYNILSNAIFIGDKTKLNNNPQYKLPNGLKVDVIISILSEEEYTLYGIDDLTFNEFQWHKIICPLNAPQELQKYYGLLYMVISNSINNNKNVLIHSTHTQVRAAHILAAYLMIENHWSYIETSNYINKVRPDLTLPVSHIIELQKLENNLSLYKNPIK
jgi:protein-tyrosine phosphatase